MGSRSQSAFPARNQTSLSLLDYSMVTYSLRYTIPTFNGLGDTGHMLHRFCIVLQSWEGEKWVCLLYTKRRADEKSTVDVGSTDSKNLWKCGNDWQASRER